MAMVSRLTGAPFDRNNVSIGGGKGTPVLFIHGLNSDQRIWLPTIERLPDAHRLITIDLAGATRAARGLADAREYVSADRYVKDVVEVIVALDLEELTIVTHSGGIQMGILTHLALPERVSSLVFVGGVPRWIDDPADGYVGAWTARDVDEMMRVVADDVQSWVRATAPMFLGDPGDYEAAELLVEIGTDIDPEWAVRLGRALLGTDLRWALREVRADTLVVHQRDDPVVPEHLGPWMLEQLVAARSAELVRLTARGHFAPLDAPDEVAELIETYLAGQERQAARSAA